MIVKKIVIKSQLSPQEMSQRIGQEISQKAEFFPSKIMSGKISGLKFQASINTQNGLVDPFKNEVAGTINSVKNETVLKIETSFGLLNWIMILMWFIPLIFVLHYNSNQELANEIKIFGVFVLMGVIIFIIFWIKLTWDNRRLRNLLEKIIDE